MGLPYWTPPPSIDLRDATKTDLSAVQRSPIRRRESPRIHRSAARRDTNFVASGTNPRTRRPQVLEELSDTHRRLAELGDAATGQHSASRHHAIPPPEDGPLRHPSVVEASTGLPRPMQWLYEADGPPNRRFTHSPSAADDDLRRLPLPPFPPGPLASSSLRETWSPLVSIDTSGLGDRERSITPHGEEADAWDTMLTTIAPDTQLPSFDSSFTSAAASASASFSANRSNQNSNSASNSISESRSFSGSASSSRTHLTIPSPTLAPLHMSGGNGYDTTCPSDTEQDCDTTHDDTDTDTEAEIERLAASRHPRSPPPPRRTSSIRETLRSRPWRGSHSASGSASARDTPPVDGNRARALAREAHAFETNYRDYMALRRQTQSFASRLRSLDEQARALERDRQALRAGLLPDEGAGEEWANEGRRRPSAAPRSSVRATAVGETRAVAATAAATAAPDAAHQPRDPRDILVDVQISRVDGARDEMDDSDDRGPDIMIVPDDFMRRGEGDASRFLRHYESFAAHSQPRDSPRRSAHTDFGTSPRDRERRRFERALAATAAMATTTATNSEPHSPVASGSEEAAAAVASAAAAERDRHDPTLAQGSMLGNDPELETMRAILERMSRRGDIPEEWWLSAGLSPAITRGRL